MTDAPPDRPPPLSAEQLCHGCDPAGFPFETTDELGEHPAAAIGQARAVEAIEFGLGMDRAGYHLFAIGPEGLNKREILRHYIERAAAGRPPDEEFCYVNNFEAPHKPRLLRVPAGRGHRLRAAMARFVFDVKAALSAAFTGEEYRTAAQVIQQETEDRQNKAMEEVREHARARGIALLRTPLGFGLAPLRDEHVLSPKEFQELLEEEQKRVQAEIAELEKELQAALRKMPQWLAEARERISALNERTASLAVDHLIARIKASFEDLPQVGEYLEQVRKDVVTNAEAFLQVPERTAQRDSETALAEGPKLFWRYRVNLLVDHAERCNAPLVFEDEPTFERLFGRIENRAEMGALVTDFNLIRPGSLHEANGGYLIVDAWRLLRQPLAWDGLKRMLEAGEIRIEPLATALGFTSTTTLQPEPVPLDVKVVLIAERQLYYLLAAVDPDFDKHFKVLVDFDEAIDRTGDNRLQFAHAIAAIARDERLGPFDRGAVARLVEFAARHAEDARKLSVDREKLRALMREAQFLARRASLPAVGAAQVEAARTAEIRRKSRLAERLQEQIERGNILIDSEGATVGQVNGLSVLGIGDHVFGKPSRITARVRLGRGDVVDIEREVRLGGPLHSKGVLILSGYLGAHYAPDHPLSLSASLVFEQSYGGVEGDSASAAELFALLSALAEVPVRQSLAVTGSVDQYGRIQVIGAVNEKIEGFFDLCAARGLTGDQGVLIPAANVEHLMLADRVVEAVSAGRFAIYPIASIDQGIELLTGQPAGRRDETGGFPEGSFNARVRARLIDFAARRRAFVRSDEPAGGG